VSKNYETLTVNAKQQPLCKYMVKPIIQIIKMTTVAIHYIENGKITFKLIDSTAFLQKMPIQQYHAKVNNLEEPKIAVATILTI
jgi:hypothetical protein